MPEEISHEVLAFATEIGSSGPVTVAGGRTQWTVGGSPLEGVREVTAPSGIWAYEPEEMTVRCGAGTTLQELSAALSKCGQMVPFDLSPSATVGGALAVGRSGYRRLRYGHIRDFVLQVRHIDHKGQVVSSGGPTVKNVSGYDLCRLMVGSLGKLGCLAEVTLRCLPIPQTSKWLTGRQDPFDVFAKLYRPSAILWDGDQVWVCLEGVSSDVEAQSDLLDLEETAVPPRLPDSGRMSLTPKALKTFDRPSGNWVAEVGVGVVHMEQPNADPAISNINLSLMRELENRLDPGGRFNPGRKVLSE